MSRVSRLLNRSLDVWRFTRVSDGMGGWVETWAKVGSVRARLSQPNATERTLADQSGAKLTHVAYLEPEAAVRRGDELRVSTRKFKVLATYEPSEPGTYLRAECEETQSAT
ncbi:phage head closure protein [Streptomyces albidoflavus]|uniref:phage head closure protein n=1 Tax=Streptomyces albidoflavus TaxID=1886 RepID=UPI003243B46F